MLAIVTTHPIQYQVPLWQALARDGRTPFEVWYLTSHGVETSLDPGFGQRFAWDLNMLSGYPHRFLAVSPGATPNSFWKCRVRESLADRMRSAGVQAVWIQGWQVLAYWQAVWTAKKIGAEVWLRGESNDFRRTQGLKFLIKEVVLRHLFERVDRFLYIGSANRRLYENFGVDLDKLYPAPYAVDNQRFADRAEAIRPQRSRIRRQWRIPDDAFCVLFCGKFIAKKRPLDLINAAHLLIVSNQLSNIHLLFVGSGELGDDLRIQCNVMFDAESLPPSNHPLATDNRKPAATFAGFLNQTEISKAYVVADCLVLPSDSGETWGLVVNEAIASGLPAVVGDACGCAEDLIAATDRRLVFSTGSVATLSASIAYVATDTFTNRQARVLQNFSIATTVQTVTALWESKARALPPL
jgi:glycosyltransferase involved in cell wall biosynthesis